MIQWWQILLLTLYSAYQICDELTIVSSAGSPVFAGFMFVGLFGTANYFGRLANYFSIFPAIALPMILKNAFRTLLTKKVFGHCAKWFKRRKPLTK